MKLVSIICLTLLVAGCSSSQQEKVYPKGEEASSQTVTKKQYTAAPPKRTFKPKVVQADNYSSEYMYPSDKVQSTPVKKTQDKEESLSSETMTKEECIAMIGKEKFEKYTEMFSGEAAAIKRCRLLKAMQDH
ncbi:MAG: hypothetical protein ABXS91_02290 [Sulfurimonas sp.]